MKSDCPSKFKTIFHSNLSMLAYLRHALALLRALMRSRAELHTEILALRHQLIVYERTAPRPRLHPTDRLFWSILSRRFVDWREALVIVQPETVLRWRRRRFREHWARLSRAGRRAGRPRVPQDLRGLIRRMYRANPTWGSPRICGELAKLGLDVARSTSSPCPRFATGCCSSSSCWRWIDAVSSTST